MLYKAGTFIKPPRAEMAIPPDRLNVYEQQGWRAQIKKNGTNSVIAVGPDHSLTAWQRTGAPHKAWAFDEASAAAFKALPKGPYVFNAELLHSKGGGVRNTNYIHDIFVCNGELLLNHTYEERWQILFRLFEPHKLAKSHYIINENTWLARNLYPEDNNIEHVFNSLSDPLDEGIIMKNPTHFLRSFDDNSWLVKTRKPHKNYSY